VARPWYSPCQSMLLCCGSPHARQPTGQSNHVTQNLSHNSLGVGHVEYWKRTRELYLKGLRFWISEATPERVSTCISVQNICSVPVLEGSKGAALCKLLGSVSVCSLKKARRCGGDCSSLRVSLTSLLRYTYLLNGPEMTTSVVCDAFAVNAPLFKKIYFCVLDYCLSCRPGCTHTADCR